MQRKTGHPDRNLSESARFSAVKRRASSIYPYTQTRDLTCVKSVSIQRWTGTGLSNHIFRPAL